MDQISLEFNALMPTKVKIKKIKILLRLCVQFHKTKIPHVKKKRSMHEMSRESRHIQYLFEKSPLKDREFFEKMENVPILQLKRIIRL